MNQTKTIIGAIALARELTPTHGDQTIYRTGEYYTVQNSKLHGEGLPDGAFQVRSVPENWREIEARKRRNEARRERESALRDIGLVKVLGAMGGTYWE